VVDFTMLPSKQEIHRRLLVWLNAQNFVPVIEEDTTVYIRMHGEIGYWQCRIIVDDSYPRLNNPAVVRFVSQMPIRVPKSRVADTAIMLDSLSRYIMVGHLALSKDRTITYHIYLTLDGNSPFEKCFEFGLRQSVFYCEEHFGFLCFFCFNSECNHRRADFHLNLSELGKSKLTYPGILDEMHSEWVIKGKDPEEP